MARRPWLLGAGFVVLTAAVVGALFISTRPQIIEAGQTVVFVEGRDLTSFGQDRAGMGITGTLGLVGERCVALVSDAGSARIIVWPPGTKVSGSDQEFSITSEGETVRLGDRIDAGTLSRQRFAYFEERLPRSCRNVPLIDVGLAS